MDVQDGLPFAPTKRVPVELELPESVLPAEQEDVLDQQPVVAVPLVFLEVAKRDLVPGRSTGRLDTEVQGGRRHNDVEVVEIELAVTRQKVDQRLVPRSKVVG